MPARTAGSEFEAWSNIDMTAKKVLHRRPGTAIGDKRKRDTRNVLKKQAADICHWRMVAVHAATFIPNAELRSLLERRLAITQ